VWDVKRFRFCFRSPESSGSVAGPAAGRGLE
jgi:hypothetical protein